MNNNLISAFLKFISFAALYISLVSCSDFKSEVSSTHKYIETKGRDGSIDFMIDESSTKSALELSDFENSGNYDVVQLISTGNKYMVIIFEQDNKPIIMNINTSEQDSQKWSANIIIDSNIFLCARGKAGLWYFKDKMDVIHYIHLLPKKNGYRIDSINEFK